MDKHVILVFFSLLGHCTLRPFDRAVCLTIASNRDLEIDGLIVYEEAGVDPQLPLSPPARAPSFL
jgi:hypothetical protein